MRSSQQKCVDKCWLRDDVFFVLNYIWKMHIWKAINLILIVYTQIIVCQSTQAKNTVIHDCIQTR